MSGWSTPPARGLTIRVAACALAAAVALACDDGRAAAAGTARAARDTTPADTAFAAARAATERLQGLCRSDSAMTRFAAEVRARDSAAKAAADSARRAADPDSSAVVASVAPDSAKPPRATHTRRTRSRAAPRTPARPAALHWNGPVAVRAVSEAPLPGSLLPGCRVVAYYGNPLSRRMGILGEIQPDSMLARLERQAEAYARADSAVPVLPALELIATVAQGNAGRDGMYRARMPDSLIEKVASWAERKNYLLILDVQVGRSSVEREIAPLLPYLRRPYVHLALDPEFAMPTGKVPGRVIGTLDARAVNVVVDTLASMVSALHLPPKMLIVHRFTRPMLTNQERIRLDPRVQVVIDMDGFGAPHLKRSSYQHYVFAFPVQFAGFKLFYKNDRPMLTPEQVVKLVPIPMFIMYQ